MKRLRNIKLATQIKLSIPMHMSLNAKVCGTYNKSTNTVSLNTGTQTLKFTAFDISTSYDKKTRMMTFFDTNGSIWSTTQKIKQSLSDTPLFFRKIKRDTRNNR